MSTIIAHASIDENRHAKNGQAGDQTKKEVCRRAWYNKGWDYVIRFKDAITANKVADCMEMAADNDYIGYDQNQRNSLLNKARPYNYNVSKIKEPCETDCSGVVSVACMYAGVPESALTLNGNCATTRTLKNSLLVTGLVDVYSSPAYTQLPDKLLRGDILLKEGQHVVTVVEADDTSNMSELDRIAREVIAGKWGTGVERKQRLRAAGYNPSMIQVRVNELLKG